MNDLREVQILRAIDEMKAYLNAVGESGMRLTQEGKELDQKRIKAIENELKPLLTKFSSNQISLPDFKIIIDSFNKKNNYWGFSGIKGQMFFNQLLNTTDNLGECEREVKIAIKVPDNETSAVEKIANFSNYINHVTEQFVTSGGSKRKIPYISSIPFFLSYFWQIQDNKIWPIYYTNDVKAMRDLNLFEPTNKLGEDYLKFKEIYEELVKIFSKASNKQFDFYSVEHVFFHRQAKQTNRENDAKEAIEGKTKLATLPDSYTPPIIEILPKLAKNDRYIEKLAEEAGITIHNAFEKYVNSAFTILSYETELLGQGKGRVPDGLAIDSDNNYAIIWDTKVRSDRYSMGTDDRAIKEYILTQTRELQRKRRFRNIYYIIISSKFANDYLDTISNLKMETNVNEVILMEANALVEIVDAKLRDPLVISLGSDGIQRLFAQSGILTKNRVKEILS